MNEVLGFAAVIVSILAAQLFNNSRLNAVESRLEARLDRMQAEFDGRLEQLHAESNGRMNELNGRIDRLQTELIGRTDRIQADLAQFYRELGRHDAKIESIEKKAG